MLTNLKFRYVLLVLCCTATPLQAAFDERYRLTIGRSVTDFDSDISINSRDDSIDKEFDFEDRLGLNTKVQLSWVRGVWRMGDRHRLALLYVPIKRTSQLTSQKDLEVAGNVIKAGASISTEINTHVFDIEYIYSFYKNPDLELGITGGIYWMNSRVQLTAAGDILLEGEDQPAFRTDNESNQRLIAPLPLIGVDAAYAINPQWNVQASARYLGFTVGDIEGRILNLNVNTDYYINNHLGLGAGLTSFDVDVRQNGIVFVNALSYQYDAVQVYLVLKY